MQSIENPTTVYQLFQQSARRYADQTAITYVQEVTPDFIDEKVTYVELLENINRVVRSLNERVDKESLEKKNKERAVISFLLPNILQSQYIMWGAETYGIASPINTLLNEDALVALLTRADTDILFALGPNPQGDIWEKALAVADRLPNNPKLISVAFPANDDHEHFDDLIKKYSGESLPDEWLPVSNDIASFIHTGGTTGIPKLAMHSHANQLWMVDTYRQSMAAGVGDVGINGLPLFHVAGSLIVGLSAMGQGVNMLLPTMANMRNPDVIERYWELIEHYQVTIAGGIPTSLVAIANIPIGNTDISSLRYMITGGAPTPLRVAEDIESITGCPLHQIYGLTETSGTFAMPNIDNPAPPGSGGHVYDETAVRIDAPEGEAGEICVRGPMVFQGYLGMGNPDLENGWLRSGDLGYLDENNNIFITGRVKDLIIRSGHNIDPSVIEACLELHPSVAMAAAVGKPDAYAGELPVAFVQLNPAQQVSEGQLEKYAMSKINERPACPKVVYVMESLPITAVGKIFKPALRAIASERAVEDAFEGMDVNVQAEVLSNGNIKVSVEGRNGDEAIEDKCQDISGRLGIEIQYIGSY